MQRLADDRQGAIRMEGRLGQLERKSDGEGMILYYVYVGCGHSEERGEWLRGLSSLSVRGSRLEAMGEYNG